MKHLDTFGLLNTMNAQKLSALDEDIYATYAHATDWPKLLILIASLQASIMIVFYCIHMRTLMRPFFCMN